MLGESSRAARQVQKPCSPWSPTRVQIDRLALSRNPRTLPIFEIPRVVVDDLPDCCDRKTARARAATLTAGAPDIGGRRWTRGRVDTPSSIPGIRLPRLGVVVTPRRAAANLNISQHGIGVAQESFRGSMLVSVADARDAVLFCQ